MTQIQRVEGMVDIIIATALYHRIKLSCAVSLHDGCIFGMHLRDKLTIGQRLVCRCRDVALKRYLVARQHLIFTFKIFAIDIQAIAYRNLVRVGAIVREAER